MVNWEKGGVGWSVLAGNTSLRRTLETAVSSNTERERTKSLRNICERHEAILSCVRQSGRISYSLQHALERVSRVLLCSFCSAMALSVVLHEAKKRWFILGVVTVITLAKIFPPLGAKGGRHSQPWWALNRMASLRSSEA